jgi:hypothetical protein
MSLAFQSAPGRYHVQVKVHGPEEKIKLFHAILKSIETDWAFWQNPSYTHNSRIHVCKKCKGIVINCPRINAADIKSAAAQAEISVRVYNFAKENKCGGSVEENFHLTEFIERKYASVLYSHKPGRIQLGTGAAWVGDEPPQEVASRRVITMPPVTEVVQ